MIRLFIRLSLCFLWFCGLCMFSSAVWAATLNVPSIEYPTIQSAIDAALIGDTVLVADGTYAGDDNKRLDFNGKAITVQSENGPETCIIDCEGSSLGFYFHSAEPKNAVVSGFTITRGGSGGIRILDASPTIRNCTISACSSVGSGGGIDCRLSESGEHVYSPNFENCTITGNSSDEGGGMFCSADSYSAHPSSITITNCTFSNNQANDNSGGMSCFISSNASLSITGCTFTGNKAYESAGGLSCTTYNTTSSLTVKNCTFENNTANNYDGGGIRLDAQKLSTLEIIDCTINDNSAKRKGGGIFCRGVPNITRCTIAGNTVTGSTAFGGGGICCDTYSAPNITGCTILANSAPYFYGGGGGGIFVGNNSSATINGCTISENYADGGDTFGGGGIFCSGTGSYPVVISNCIIKENSTDCRGGGILCMFSSPTISNCKVIENLASDGGGINFYNSPSSPFPFIENCDISHNTAQRHGGGIYTYASAPLVVNTTITNNTASGGGGVYLSGEDLILASSTVSQNTASIGGGVYASVSTLIMFNSILWNDSPQEIAGFFPDELIVYSNVQGGVSGEGNIDEDPEFVDPLNDNFHLASNSPCIDKGTNDLLNLLETDKDGKPRVIDGNGDSNAVIDMGAYEFGDICEGDFDGDGDVDGSDLATFATDFGRTDCNSDCSGDFDGDGDIDGSDLAVFAADFGRTDCP